MNEKKPAELVVRGTRSTVISSTASDSHTWNLVFLQLVFEELGFEVTNLGSCVPAELLAAECSRLRPDLIVLSSVNGHGFHDGLHAIRLLREQPELRETSIVIGGKLAIDRLGEAQASALLEAGFDLVCQDRPADVAALRSFAAALPSEAVAA
jgi:methylaspartate mutase sigma subunit